MKSYCQIKRNNSFSDKIFKNEKTTSINKKKEYSRLYWKKKQETIDNYFLKHTYVLKVLN